MSGFSQGGSMAFRFNCEKSESIGGLVIGGQAWFDPTLGYYDYTNNNVLKGKAICNPTFKRPFLNVIGNVDNYYGEDASSVISGFVGIEHGMVLVASAMPGTSVAAARSRPLLENLHLLDENFPYGNQID